MKRELFWLLAALGLLVVMSTLAVALSRAGPPGHTSIQASYCDTILVDLPASVQAIDEQGFSPIVAERPSTSIAGLLPDIAGPPMRSEYAPPEYFYYVARRTGAIGTTLATGPNRSTCPLHC